MLLHAVTCICCSCIFPVFGEIRHPNFFVAHTFGHDAVVEGDAGAPATEFVYFKGSLRAMSGERGSRSRQVPPETYAAPAFCACATTFTCLLSILNSYSLLLFHGNGNASRRNAVGDDHERAGACFGSG